ncbi:MAG: stress response translation initiation inhibitor YciH, partial [Proteobacteria bacterium]|nr:stress response translation initiation inhibitor YciH [Pseudomonadota bacterium]
MKPKNSASAGGLVYSTQHGRICPGCRMPVANCQCRRATKAPDVSGAVVRVGRETKGRKGKGVTVVTGVPL